MKDQMRPHYIAAYDVELSDTSAFRTPVPTCLQALERIVEVHHQFQMPATFFIVGRALDADPLAFRRLLDHPLFEPASHTYSHILLRDHPICGPAAPREKIIEEVVQSKQRIEQVFGRPCLGLRTPCAFVDGLRGAPDLLQIIAQAGYEYISSVAWGPDFSLPAPLQPSFTYAVEGFPQLREFPGHGWHENLLKGHNRIFGMGAARLLLFPPLYPQAVPPGFVSTPQEEFHYNNRVFLEQAIQEKAEYVSLIWHPWSLGLFDPSMKMLELTFEFVRQNGLQPCTFASLHQALKQRIPPGNQKGDENIGTR